MTYDFPKYKELVVPYFVSLIKNDEDEYCANDFYRFAGVPVPFIGEHGKFNGFNFGALKLGVDFELVFRIVDAD